MRKVNELKRFSWDRGEAEVAELLEEEEEERGRRRVSLGKSLRG